MDGIGTTAVWAAMVLAILVAATWILHQALHTQNKLLKEQCLLMAAASADEKKAAEAIETNLRVQVQHANGRVELLRDSLMRIGINPDSLESTVGTDDFWRVGALRLIVAQLDESRVDSAADANVNSATILTARSLVDVRAV